jgi:hypothetical protein
MSDTDITAAEAKRLRQLLDQIDQPDTLPLAPVIDPGSFAGRLAAAHEAKRVERVAVAEAAREREQARLEHEARVERERHEANAPRIASIDATIGELQAERVPIVAEYEQRVAPIDARIVALRAEREALS